MQLATSQIFLAQILISGKFLIILGGTLCSRWNSQVNWHLSVPFTFYILLEYKQLGTTWHWRPGFGVAQRTLTCILVLARGLPSSRATTQHHPLECLCFLHPFKDMSKLSSEKQHLPSPTAAENSFLPRKVLLSTHTNMVHHSRVFLDHWPLKIGTKTFRRLSTFPDMAWWCFPLSILSLDTVVRFCN